MIRREAERLILEGALTNSTVGRMVAEGRQAIEAGATAIDLAGVTAVDSAAIALVLDWTRAAKKPIALLNPSLGFTRLARLYGADELLFPEGMPTPSPLDVGSRAGTIS